MARVRNVPATRRRHKRYLKAAKGYFSGRSKLYRRARETVERGWAFATIHRRHKKRDFRALWNARISAEARDNDISYSRFMSGLRKSSIQLNRKSLSEIAATDKKTFKALVEIAKSA